MAEKYTQYNDSFVATGEKTYAGMDNETQELKSCLDHLTIYQECMNVAEPRIKLQANIAGELCESDDELDITLIPEIGRDLCRVEKDEMDYGGYRKEILTENLTERDKAVIICINCEGIMKEACMSSSGEQFCSCCEEKHPSKQTPNLSVRKMINSLKCSCPLIDRGCKWLDTLDECEKHLDACGYVRESCKLMCGVVLSREELGIHEKEKCPQRKVECNNCYQRFKSLQLDEHYKECPKMEESCNLCGTRITRKEMERHLKHDCCMIQEMCKLGCGVRLTRNELSIHVKDNCVQREVQCEHCFISVKFCDCSKHFKECPYVELPCDLCGVEKCRKDMTGHIKDDCPENDIDCPFVRYKCLTRIKRKDIDKHLEEKETRHLGLKLTAMEDLITKQSEEINKQKEEMKSEKANTSQQLLLLYSITETIKIIWKIGKVTNLVIGDNHSLESVLYRIARYSFRLKFRSNREIYIVFPGTPSRYDIPFIAKCHIALSYGNTINCGRIEVKQSNLMRGCERMITSISKEDIDKYAEPKSPGDSKKDLTLWIFITSIQ